MKAFIFLFLSAALAFRSYDGTYNNLQNPTWGAANIAFSRLTSQRELVTFPNERNISNILLNPGYFRYPNGSIVQEGDLNLIQRKFGLEPESRGLNTFAVAFIQFISHDLAFQKLSSFIQPGAFGINLLGCTQIGVPDELCSTSTLTASGWREKLVSRNSITNLTDTVKGTVTGINIVSSYLDLNTVYGSSNEINAALRTGIDGLMKVDPITNGVPRRNLDSTLTNIPNDCDVAGPPNGNFHAAGDLRVDENGQITLLHILFLREHNRLARLVKLQYSNWTDEEIFQKARNLNIAQYQKIIYEEFLPTFFGKRAVKDWLGQYSGYNSNINPSISEEFDIAGFRLHSLLNLPLLILADNGTMLTFGTPVTFGLTPNAQGIYDLPYKKQERGTCEPVTFDSIGPDSMLRGALNQHAQENDLHVTNGIRSLRIGSPSSTPGNVDVEAANLFRGRERGVNNIDLIRQSLNLPSYYIGTSCVQNDNVNDPVSCFQLLGVTYEEAVKLQSLYGKLKNIDAFIAFMAERHANGDHPSRIQRSSVGETATKLILEQFKNLRNGDRFFYRNAIDLLTESEIDEIHGSEDLIVDLLQYNFPNLDIPENPFLVY